MKYNFFAICSTILLFSCSDRNSEIEALKKENQILKNEIIELKTENSNYDFQAIAVSNKTELKLGEKYIADIHLSAVNKNNPPRVILCQVKNGQLTKTKDTLEYDYTVQCSTYQLTTKSIGNFEWGGVIIQNINGQKKEYPFTLTYSVKK